MAERRQWFDHSFPTPATPMVPTGGAERMEKGGNASAMAESSDTFRRRITPVTGMPTAEPTTLQELLEMLKGGQ